MRARFPFVGLQVYEIVDNAIDEVQGGFAKTVKVLSC
jgi:DNA gyrase/topoisomerase IV subunit B